MVHHSLEKKGENKRKTRKEKAEGNKNFLDLEMENDENK